MEEQEDEEDAEEDEEYDEEEDEEAAGESPKSEGKHPHGKRTRGPSIA